MTWLIDHIVGISWVAISWAFVIAVWGGIAYRRWQRRERADAAETERKLELVKPYEGDVYL
jgi:hypothetical protein